MKAAWCFCRKKIITYKLAYKQLFYPNVNHRGSQLTININKKKQKIYFFKSLFN